MKKSFLVLFAVCLLSASCNQKQAQVQPAQNQPTSQQQAQPVDQTSSWQTYTSAKYGFGIKYPSELLPPILNDSTTSNGQPAVNLSFPQKDNDFFAVQMVNDTTFVSQGSEEKNISAFMQSPSYKGAVWDKQFSVTNGQAFYYINQDSKAGPTPTVYLVGPSGVWLMASDQLSFGSELLLMASTFKFILPSTQGQVYENQYMKITIPTGWNLQEVTTTTQNQSYDKNTGKVTIIGPPIVQKTGAVNITKGNYILYINPQAGQASGVEGGRFAEIAMGAPSADAVVTEQPSPPCGISETSAVMLDYRRVDLYVSKQNTSGLSYCASPSNGSTVWYFSYLTDNSNGYFNYYKSDQPPGLVVTMAYNSKVVNSFPIKGSADLNSALSEMSSIVKTLEIKQQ